MYAITYSNNAVVTIVIVIDNSSSVRAIYIYI